jgi:hypothetical protein
MIRAHVHESYMGDVAVSVVMHPPEGSYDITRRILHFGGPGAHLASVWDEIPALEDVAPTFRLGHDEARAVLDALTVHYHGAEDTRALRRDYDAERKRVDTLTRQLTEIIGLLAVQQAHPAPVGFPGPQVFREKDRT